jgi:hypothetical protein
MAWSKSILSRTIGSFSDWPNPTKEKGGRRKQNGPMNVLIAEILVLDDALVEESTDPLSSGFP